ncbi:myosin phosphatase Rho-interacting protein isoform X1 [Labeo rohita]|uniref:myosin phosphatase Rho-interacting protein isoform X1 n=1 Tax=Labeo rohita TaxID=84645 RepID=UPI0021E2D5B3|nr:myosin phosphatase Rho-interacting protein isoform X1 [Labeo rohita]
MLSTSSHFTPKTMFSTRENRCRRFQANIFNKSKCQNCFKTVDSHKISEADLFQTKPVQVGWLLLAPEDTDFSSSSHRKRKWQRRYFVLYEHGLLRYSLDEMPGTLPQGSVNMIQCCEVLDASSQTGLQNCLRLCFPDRDYYIRTESTDSFSISRWQENLIAYPKTVKSNQKKKGKDPAHPLQQTAENKISSSCSSGGAAKKSSTSGNSFTSSIKRQGSIVSGNNNGGKVSVNDNAGSGTSSATKGSLRSGNSSTKGATKNDRRGSMVSMVEEVSLPSSEKELEEEPLSGGAGGPSSLNTMIGSSLSSSLGQTSSCSDTDGTTNRLGTESGYSSLEKTSSLVVDAQPHTDSRRSQEADQQESSFLDTERPPSTFTSSSPEQNDLKTTVSTSQDSFPNDIPDQSQHLMSCSLRSKSLERRPLDSTPTPDLLNFKKGWMSRLGEDGKWRKHWFVLTDQTLRFYRDSAAEEAADLDGEINLSSCYDVTDYPVQRNYGFQIHTKDGVFTLCAMTYGIRRNWVQAVMKNIRPTVAPDVTWKIPAIKPSSIPQKVPMTSAYTRTSSCQCNTVPQEAEQRSRIRERRREGRYKTFDWAELSCKQHKEELSNLSARQWNHNNERSVPPAPASSPEEQIVRSASEASENEYLQKERLSQRQSLNIMSADIPSHLSLTGVSSRTSPESISPDSLEVDTGTVRVHCDSLGELLEAKPKEEKQVDRSTSPLPATFSSSSAQTEWQWDVELQSLRRELKAEHERNQTQERELRLSETRLQAELNDSQECLQRAELKIQESETLLKDREEVLESLRGRLEEVTGRLKATEEAQALKEVRLQRHLRLLQESQERERRSFSDSLDQSEQRSKELEERLRQKESELQKRQEGDVTEELLRRCQELQNQLEESDSEVCRLQARLQTEETLYYDMEHDYERACEEIQSLRGALLDCERVSEERFQTQLVQQQQELDRKEQELQEVLLKMAILGSSLEETEQRLKEAQNHHSEANVVCETLIEQQRCRKKGQSDLEAQPPTQGVESQRVISVIQALERKLCDTEERLRELTMHLQQQQQQLNAGPYALNDSWSSHQNPEGRLSVDALPSYTGALNSLQGTALDRTSDKPKVSLYDDGKTGSRKLVGENSGRNQALEMASRVLSLEALIVQRIASALEHPSSALLNRLSEVHVQVLRMAQGGSHNGPVEPSYSQIFLDSLEQDPVDNTLSESAIHRLCVRAEMTYLIHTLYTHTSQEQKGSELFYVLPWPESSSSGTKKENCSKQGSRLADISPPELAPYSEQMEDELENDLVIECSEAQLACRKILVVELRFQAQSLQNLSTQLQSNVREVDLPGELPSAILRAAMCQATLAYTACRLRSALQQEMSALRKQREQAECECRAMCRSMEALFQEQTERYEEKLREERVVVEKAEQDRVSAETNAQLRMEEAEKLQLEFEEKLQELQKIHEEEMSHLHEYYIQNLSNPATPSELEVGEETEQVSVTALQDRIRELEAEVTCLRAGLSNQDVKALQLDLETIKATYEHGFSIMEDSHQRVIEEMQRQHQREVERLTEERERVLQEETNATIAAIEAMRKAHKEEMDKTQKALQNGAGVDIRQLRAQYNEELETLHRELEVLSEQYSQKCLENTHLSRTIETEREALSSTQRENQELRIHSQELNEFLAAELSLMHSRMNGEVKHSQCSQEKDVYQLEVNLRVKESEIKCLKQEINSLKLELQAGNTYFKDLDSELSVSEVKAQSDFAKLRMVPARQQSLKYDLMKSKSNQDFLEDHASLTQPVRSKSLKDGLTVLERMKLFDLTSTQKI